MVSERTFHGEAAAKEIGVHPIHIWWRRGESNPCPKTAYQSFLRVYPVILSPAARRPSAGSSLWQPLSHDTVQGAPVFTFTTNRRSYPRRGTRGKNGRLIRQREQQYCCRLFCKVADFIEAPHLYSLTRAYNPRRNLYAPLSFADCSAKNA